VLDVIDFIGKENDVQLTLELKSQLGSGEIAGFMMFQNLFAINSVQNMTRTFRMARMGTIAHLRSQQSLIRNWFMNRMPTTITIPSQPTPSDLHMRQSTPKSLSRNHIIRELIHAGMGGYNCIFDSFNGESFQKVEFDEISHRAYVNWLIVKALSTAKRSDLKGSLTAWHQLSEWEKHLTSIIRVTDLHVAFEVADDFDMLPLVQGFQSCNDWDALTTCPGIDTDRRIARYVFFAEWACDTLIREAPAESSAAAAATGSAALTAPLHPATAAGDQRSGTDGTALAADAPFDQPAAISTPAALSSAQVDAPPPARAARACNLCGETAAKLCSRCGLVLYCSRRCQVDDWPAHRLRCELMSTVRGGTLR
jgi:hypothetical protein